MSGFKISEIILATGGALLQGSLTARVRGVSTDTRRVGKKDLFIAVKGEIFDGHDFLSQAAASGATGLLVSREESLPKSLSRNVAVILVEDTVKAYGLIARYHRRRFPKLPVIAITGSAGKTTTKELIASVLKTKYRVLFSKGTENNHMGVPSTLLKIKPSHDVAVIEAGTNHHGEINWLGTVIEPTIAVFTNVGPSHLAGLGSPAGVFKEKSALIDHTAKNGTIIVNADDPFLSRILKRKLPQRVLGYSVDQKSDIRARDVQGSVQGMSFSYKNRPFRLKVPVWANVHNALAAVACGECLKVPFVHLQRGIANFRSPKGRQVFHRVRSVSVIDDTYNANPLSFRNAVRTLVTMKKPAGKLILVAADMLELGPSSNKLHRAVGAFVARQGIDVILGCGKMARFIISGAADVKGKAMVRHLKDQDAVQNILKDIVCPGDTVLVKGSRGMKMEKIVQGLIDHLKG